MKLALICPSNMLFMPYVKNYTNILDSLNIKYVIINWDRLKIGEEIDGHTFTDKKIKHQRNYYDYMKFKQFVTDKLEKEKFDKIIIFTLQLGHFFKKYLIKNYAGNYIFDIRDYNKIFKLSNFKRLIEESYACVISSPGFKEWLPQSNKYTVNHNTMISSLKDIIYYNEKNFNVPAVILSAGILRHWDMNLKLVDQLKNSNKYFLVFHGEGSINDKLKTYIEIHKIHNIEVYGRYKKEEEEGIYKSADLVNALFPNNNINVKTLLSNRLYNSVLYGKPMLSFYGTYQAEIIRKYNIGLVLESLDDLEKQIDNYLDEFSYEKYNNGRIDLLTNVIEENEQFERMLKNFICN